MANTLTTNIAGEWEVWFEDYKKNTTLGSSSIMTDAQWDEMVVSGRNNIVVDYIEPSGRYYLDHWKKWLDTLGADGRCDTSAECVAHCSVLGDTAAADFRNPLATPPKGARPYTMPYSKAPDHSND